VIRSTNKLFHILIFDFGTILLNTSCTFNFELTSQRTALENQVLGSYKEIEDELILVSAIRGLSNARTSESPAARARKSQDFNRDDIDELKSKHLIGETQYGELIQTNKLRDQPLPIRKLAIELIQEENSVRFIIWNQIIISNKNLTSKDLPEIRKNYARLIWEQAPSGHLFFNEKNQWIEK